MTPLPTALRVEPDIPGIVGWRLGRMQYRDAWNSGYGAREYGGRWNVVGRSIVYASLDPSTALAEVAVHVSFQTLLVVPHVMTNFRVLDAAKVRVVGASQLSAHPDWLEPGLPTPAQQAFGTSLFTEKHPFVVIPSVVSPHSWNLMFDAELAKLNIDYELIGHEQYRLDRRLASAAIAIAKKRRLKKRRGSGST